ncbi:uncharacterized protein PITG_02410 [Phytophthora infestans T30-4]|uniref:Uncharacterized protein n=1 Tax=Phytophthora infestans (strain T30-4) TaxID=403677 RepID=D0MW89_PHYIT|nr:uncharacterized protein PITG_02410 [Phytophthora infestans T30-4]EEY63902.1 conserved hypothetical protein [Phytophthora infestans T30-4]|eukprot:XP_002907338.1 conserved hypothetical protein [Phytophthora infestans T30-4]
MKDVDRTTGLISEAMRRLCPAFGHRAQRESGDDDQQFALAGAVITSAPQSHSTSFSAHYLQMTLNNENGPSAKVHLSREDYGLLVTWMEIPENFAAAHGTSNKTTVSRGPQKTKTQAFNELAVYLNTHKKTSNLPTLTGANVQQRWRTYKTKKLQPTLKKSRTETGLGMPKKEMRHGFSIQGKLDKLCPHFARMEKLFATKANARAPATLQLASTQVEVTPTTKTTIPKDPPLVPR